MYQANRLLALFVTFVYATGWPLNLKNKEDKSFADIFKLINTNPGLEVRMEFVQEDDHPMTNKSFVSSTMKTSTKKSALKIPAETNNEEALSLVKRLNETSTHILDQLNKTVLKLDLALKHLNEIEKSFQKRSQGKGTMHLTTKTYNQTDDIIEQANVTDLLLFS